MFFKKYKDDETAKQLLNALKANTLKVYGNEYSFGVTWNEKHYRVLKNGFTNDLTITEAEKRTDRVIRVRNNTGGRYDKNEYPVYGSETLLEVSNSLLSSIHEECEKQVK